jgi:hypothetical protein
MAHGTSLMTSGDSENLIPRQTHVIVDRDMEQEYREHPDDFLVTDNIYCLGDDEISKMEARKEQNRKLCKRKNMFTIADWRMQRALDNGDLEEQAANGHQAKGQ